jgi:arylformamidase
MKIIDLSHPLTEGMPQYPGKDGPSIKDDAFFDKDNYREKLLTILTHTGTHIDAPAHMTEEGLCLDELPVQTYMGPAAVLHRKGSARGPLQGPITLEEVKVLEEDLGGVDFLLLDTGWDKYWGEEQFFQDYPCLTEEAALWLLSFNLKGVGLDTTSADPVGSKTFIIHKTLLGAGLVIVENLKGLAKLPDKGFVFSCLPLSIVKADGSPVRAAAVYI